MRIRMAGIVGAMAGMVFFANTAAAEWQTWEAGDRAARVFVDGPVDAAQSIVLVHDWFGVTPFYEDAAQHWADRGYRVIALDLYDRESATTHAEAWALMQALDAEVAAAQIDMAIAHAAEGETSIALMAFSMGVPFAIDAAGRHAADVDAVAVWYGDTSLEDGEAETLTMPLLAIYGSLDGAAAEQASTLSLALDGAGGAAESYVYPGAHHAFAQPLFNAGETYDPSATQAAWDLTDSFFARRMN